MRLDLGDAAYEQSVDFDSTWRQSVATVDGDCQTDTIEYVHQKTQHPKMREMETQSEAATDMSAVPLVRSDFHKLRELDTFLEQCTPLLEAQLQRNLTSRAFDGHEVTWEEQYDNVACLHSLKHTGALASLSPEAATCVVWNAPGTVVAAAYGALDRNDWPRCASMLCVWSVFGRKLDPKKADTAIELPDCLTCLAFHPTDPSLLAGGAYNGDVLLWRIGIKERIDPLVGKSTLTNYTHHEPVQQLQWTRDPQRSPVDGGFVLASVGSDGKLLVWNPSGNLQASGGWQPSQGFLLSAAVFHLQDKDGDGQITQEEVHLAQQAAMSAPLEGGAALSFSAEDPTAFVVGLEAGQLFKGSLLANQLRAPQAVMREVGELPWSPAAAALVSRVPQASYTRLKQKVERDTSIGRDKEVLPAHVYASGVNPRELFASPLTFCFQPHSGPVYAARFSPFHRNVFLSASTDGSIRLYNQLSPHPFHVIEPGAAPILCAAWSPARPLVFAAASADGQLYLFDLKKSKGRPEVTLNVTSDDKVACTYVAFNAKSPELLATADAHGAVKIWRLSTFLSEPVAHELDALDAMASAGMQSGGAQEDEEDGGEA